MVAKTGGSDCYLEFIGNSNIPGFSVRYIFPNIPNKLEPNRPLFGSCSSRTELLGTCDCSVLQLSNKPNKLEPALFGKPTLHHLILRLEPYTSTPENQSQFASSHVLASSPSESHRNQAHSIKRESQQSAMVGPRP